MDILGFFGSVWLAIGVGIFMLAMIIGCTYDRRDRESAKWWVFFIGLAAYAVYSWNTGYRLSWATFIESELWKFIGIYLLIGLAYSVLEFALEIRRSVRRWKALWIEFRANAKRNKADVDVNPEDVATSFVASTQRYSNHVIGVAVNPDAKGPDELIVPKVDRTRLAEFVGVWMIFWPFYAVSLIVGDLLAEVARIVADVFAKISGRFVRMSFANVFKF